MTSPGATPLSSGLGAAFDMGHSQTGCGLVQTQIGDHLGIDRHQGQTQYLGL